MRKSHPLRRVVLTTAATVSGIVLLLSLKPGADPGSAAAGEAVPQRTAAAPPSAAQSPGGATLTGSVAQTQYGPVQVRITVRGGRVTRAETVQAPDSDATNDALPQLNKAAVTAGSADIDAVSGATYTSEGYRKSLQSALDQLPAGG
ncbi:FMN-binding protein [Streptomyces sp. NPDC006997]|uniref:FMN-binding protein n=1 Tax=Streptomyces sp. NPDC006997 TaxID=3155356 RepID=UPI0033E90B45